MIWERGGRRGVGRGERIIKCHQFDITWGSDAILVLESHVAAGQVDVCGLLTGILTCWQVLSQKKEEQEEEEE